jgi:hypothetical protein
LSRFGQSQKLKKIEKIENVRPKIELENEPNKVEIFNNEMVKFVPDNLSEFITKEDIIKRYGISERSFRRKLIENEITTKEQVNSKKRMVKVYSRQEVENILG